MDKRAIIIAGPNGAGKTTFALEFLPEEAACPVFINADLIAQGLSPFHPEAAAVRAGHIVLEMIAEAVRRGAKPGSIAHSHNPMKLPPNNKVELR